MIKDIMNLYSPAAGSKPFTNITSLASELGWTDIAAQSTMDYFDSQGLDQRWTREMIEAATRVNYGQVRHLFGALRPLLKQS
jgi:prenylcysteine oxidase / farnesylcysteine lyase